MMITLRTVAGGLLRGLFSALDTPRAVAALAEARAQVLAAPLPRCRGGHGD